MLADLINQIDEVADVCKTSLCQCKNQIKYFKKIKLTGEQIYLTNKTFSLFSHHFYLPIVNRKVIFGLLVC